MSGIIGGAGSRSGIIGTTELDYEEGTWTPTHTNAHANNKGTYVKIGKKVYCEGWLRADGGGTGTSSFAGLPFTVGATANAVGGGSTFWNNNDTQQYGVYGISTSKGFYFWYNGDDLAAFGDGNSTHFYLNYTTT